YGCPDLVAAALHAGAVPVLVDCSPHDPGFDLELLQNTLSARTAAVVAVNFLGLRERLREIAAICQPAGVVLIEDAAQWFPEGEDETPVDLRVLSFGRGKPVNLLGGGALLLRDGRELPLGVPVSVQPPLGAMAPGIFNALMHPMCFGMLSRVPGLGIGETRLHMLQSVRRMDPKRLARLGTAVAAWTSSERWREDRLHALVSRFDAFDDLTVRLAGRAGRLLRFPILSHGAADRDAALSALVDLGASPFYGAALPDIPGVAPLLGNQPRKDGAQAFARRLLTLPVHAGVREQDIDLMGRRIAALAAHD
ncbi:MAG: DegT/DnrJ/EryC1/StrS family aminotransferase, partial [Gammaproteobacteria bacterium]